MVTALSAALLAGSLAACRKDSSPPPVGGVPGGLAGNPELAEICDWLERAGRVEPNGEVDTVLMGDSFGSGRRYRRSDRGGADGGRGGFDRWDRDGERATVAIEGRCADNATSLEIILSERKRTETPGYRRETSRREYRLVMSDLVSADRVVEVDTREETLDLFFGGSGESSVTRQGDLALSALDVTSNDGWLNIAFRAGGRIKTERQQATRGGVRPWPQVSYEDVDAELVLDLQMRERRRGGAERRVVFGPRGYGGRGGEFFRFQYQEDRDRRY